MQWRNYQFMYNKLCCFIKKMYISDILPERNIAYSYDDVERGNR